MSKTRVRVPLSPDDRNNPLARSGHCTPIIKVTKRLLKNICGVSSFYCGTTYLYIYIYGIYKKKISKTSS